MTLMQQYQEAKSRHPGALLFFRIGDFFEMFGEDAETAAKELGLTLTCRTDHASRDHVAMAGFPHHALEHYLHRLLQAGHRLAICEPVEDPMTDKMEGQAAEKPTNLLF